MISLIDSPVIVPKTHSAILNLQVHHVGLVLLPERPKQLLPPPTLVQGPLPTLVELGGTGAAILNVEGLNFEFGLVNGFL